MFHCPYCNAEYELTWKKTYFAFSSWQECAACQKKFKLVLPGWWMYAEMFAGVILAFGYIFFEKAMGRKYGFFPLLGILMVTAPAIHRFFLLWRGKTERASVEHQTFSYAKELIFSLLMFFFIVCEEALDSLPAFETGWWAVKLGRDLGFWTFLSLGLVTGLRIIRTSGIKPMAVFLIGLPIVFFVLNLVFPVLMVQRCYGFQDNLKRIAFWERKAFQKSYHARQDWIAEMFTNLHRGAGHMRNSVPFFFLIKRASPPPLIDRENLQEKVAEVRKQALQSLVVHLGVLFLALYVGLFSVLPELKKEIDPKISSEARVPGVLRPLT